MQAGDQFKLSTDDHLVGAVWNSSDQLTEAHVQNNRFEGRIRVSGRFLGKKPFFFYKILVD